MKALLAAIEGPDEATGALAAKALTGVISGTPALQELLLDAGGAPVLIRQLDAPNATPTEAEDSKGVYIQLQDLEIQAKMLCDVVLASA